MLGSPQARWGTGLLALAVCALSGCPVDGRILLEDYGASGRDSGVAGTNGRNGSAGATAGRSAGSGGVAGVASSDSAGGGGPDARSDTSSNGSAGGGGSLGADGRAGNDANQGDTGSVGSGGSAGTAGSGGHAGTGECWDVDQVLARCGANLVRNSRFDQNASDWQPEIALTQHWDPRDGRGGADSGALSIVNANILDSGSSGLTMVGSWQCMDVAGGATYGLGARLFIPGRQGEGYAAMNIWAFADPGCRGTFLGASTPAFVSEVDTWLHAGTGIETSPGTRSLLVRLVAVKPFAQASFEVLFDDVAVRSDSGN